MQRAQRNVMQTRFFFDFPLTLTGKEDIPLKFCRFSLAVRPRVKNQVSL
jgi:hypothetical protein